MKYLILIFIIVFNINSKAQTNDTFFLKRILIDTPYQFYNAIYIDTTYDITNRKSISDFTFDHFDSVTYFRELAALKPLRKIKNVNRNFPKKWIQLYQYNNNFYTYVPSDLGNQLKFELTDSTTISYFMEGPQPSKLKKVIWLTPTHLIIRQNNYWREKKVDINIINVEKGIAIFTFRSTKYYKSLQKILMVSIDKAHLFKTVINYCTTDKVAEFEFDPIDFSKFH
jgi:hypothetical protein